MTLNFRFVVVVITSVFLVACASMSPSRLFSHYSDQNSDSYRLLAQGQYIDAEQALPEQLGGSILDNLEKGRVSFLAEHYPASKSYFEQSDNAVREQQRKATISISETATKVGALAINDNLTEYYPADYELGFMHLYLGLNYLEQNDLEGALVEIRRANMVQEQARKAREKELEAAQADMKSNGLSPNIGSVISRYPDAGKKLQAIQNGYLLFLSGLLYEANRDLGNAYIDYKRALAVMPENREVIQRTMALAKRLAMKDDLALLSKTYPAYQPLSDNQARVIVLEEHSVVKAMQSWRLDLPIYDSRGDGTIYSVALPYYPQSSRATFNEMVLNQHSLARASLVDVDLMAQQHLSEEIVTIVLRQALRVWTKDRIRKEAANGNDVGNVLFSVWNAVTEQPDTRSWMTLPSQVFSSSAVVDSGEQTVKVDNKDYNFNVDAGNTVLVWVSRHGKQSTIWHKQLGGLQ